MNVNMFIEENKNKQEQEFWKNIKPKKNHSDERLNDINKLRSEGKTYQEIGNIYGISRQRVEQIINGHN